MENIINTECNKVKFANEKQAEFYIKKLNETSSRERVPVRAYLCPRCFLWHLTSIRVDENKIIKEYDYKQILKQNYNMKAFLKSNSFTSLILVIFAYFTAMCIQGLINPNSRLLVWWLAQFSGLLLIIIIWIIIWLFKNRKRLKQL